MPRDVRSAVGNSPELRRRCKITGSRLSHEKTPAPKKHQTGVGVAQRTQAIALIKLLATVGRYSPGVVASSG
ncbi:Uncharacterised protein [Shigella dysenteriae]|uniref:Uncharacterized protein n=1 Tax=Shigella dysenteriae TaxID=622 RepID=A0A2X2I8A9_SHIDY|nr:Uncharacterised protein [Shigella dysenteriae]